MVQLRPIPQATQEAAPTIPEARRVSLDRFSANLFSGGDARLAIDPATGASRYGCRPFPAPALAAFGSSTASTVSTEAYAACATLAERFALAPAPLRARLARLEAARLRFELIHLCGLGDLPGLEVLFAPSGTDLHLIAADLFGDRLFGETTALLPDPAETGSGVPLALSGRHFARTTATGAIVEPGAAVRGLAPLTIVPVALRGASGDARPVAAIDAEVEGLARGLLDRGQRVLIVMVDGSKTGMVAPSPACALRLKQRAPQRVDVLVDACQFRIAPATLRAYLDSGFLVAVTGSKFLTGPTFSGALFVPPAAAGQLSVRASAEGLADYCAAGEWPADWEGVRGLGAEPNLGLMLRWEAALAELRAFHRLAPGEIAAVFDRFGRAVAAQLAAEPAFEALLPADLGERPGGRESWDARPTIFPFLLRHADGAPFSHDETLRAYAALRRPLAPREGSPLTPAQAALPVELGQPVALGSRDGVPISALRVCMSARLAVEAATGGEGAVLDRLRDALAKTAEVAWRVSNGAAI